MTEGCTIFRKMTTEYKPEIKELLSFGEYSLKSGVFLEKDNVDGIMY